MKLKRKKKYAWFLLLNICLFTFTCIAAQEQKNLRQLASGYFQNCEYMLATKMYERIVARQGEKTDIEILERLASCYRLINYYEKAAFWYETAIKRHANVICWLHYGDMKKCLGEYEAAKSAYINYELLSGKKVSNRLAGCDSAILWNERGQGAFRGFSVKPVNTLNTGKSDWGAISYAKEGIVFVSDSLRYTRLHIDDQISLKQDGRTGENFYKLYMKYTKHYDMIYGFTHTFNFSKYHVGPIAFSRNFDTAYATIADPGKIKYRIEGNEKFKERVLKIFVAVKDGNDWKMIEPFVYNSDEHSVRHVSLNKAGNILYFTSDKDGYGSTDIWFCEKGADGRWGPPQNCGPVINTNEEEDFAYIGADDALYFSSKGHAGMGGYDAFRAEGAKAKWSVPVNMGPPINSCAEDFCFYPESQLSGFLSSNRPGGKGSDDIYQVTCEHLPGYIKLSGQVLDSITKFPVFGAKVRIVGECLDTTIITPFNGRYSFLLPKNKLYRFSVQKQGCEYINRLILTDNELDRFTTLLKPVGPKENG